MATVSRGDEFLPSSANTGSRANGTEEHSEAARSYSIFSKLTFISLPSRVPVQCLRKLVEEIQGGVRNGEV